MSESSGRALAYAAGARAGVGAMAVARCAARAVAVNAVAALLAPFLAACTDPGAVVEPASSALRASAARTRSVETQDREPIADQYIVTFADSVADPNGLARALAAQQGGEVRHEYGAALKGFAARLPARAVEALRRNPRIARIEQDRRIQVADVELSPGSWGIDRIDQRGLPLDKAYVYSFTGAGVTAYILDSGIRFDHAEFEGRAVRGTDVIGDGMNGGDCRGHGTHVAGTVGGRMWGVAKKVTLVSVRVLDCNGSGTVSGAIAGIDWVAKNRRLPAVANISLGAALSESLNTAVRNLIAAGVQVSIAAGNSNVDACASSPSSTLEAVVVGAAGTADINDRQPFSNWGSCVDLFAPGAVILSASHADASSGVLRSGTSMAAPHVAGVMALWLHQDPAATPAQLQQLLVSNATQNVVVDAKSPNPHIVHALRGETLASVPPTASFTLACSALACSFDASGSTAGAAEIARYDWAFGDGTSGSGVTATRTYGAAGSFVVTLTVTGTQGGTGQASRTVSVSPANQAPVASFTVACDQLTCSFADGSSDADGSVASWTWNFGDGGGASVRNPTRTFAAAGTYTVRLVVNDDVGAQASTSQTVMVSGLSLRANAVKVKGQLAVDLAWAGATTAQVVVQRNGAALRTVNNTGGYRDAPVARGDWRYRACETNGGACSAEVGVQVR